MNRRVQGSMTVEAALLYPYLLMIAFLLVKMTVGQYMAVNQQAAILYDAVFTEDKFETSNRIRFADMAFELISE